MKVSVIIPTYNRSRLVSLAVESVLAQTFSNYELIVVDDGSTDGTGEALSVFGNQLHYVWQENQGESVARNHGIALAQGEYIAFLDSDDLWAPGKLAKQVPVLDENPDVVMVGCASWIIDAQGQRKSSSPVGVTADPQLLTYSALRYQNHFFGGGSTALVRHCVLSEMGEAFFSELRYGEEWDLWIRLAALGRICTISGHLAFIRQHASTQTSAMDPQAIDRRLADYTHILKRNPPLDGGNGLDPAMAKQYLRAALDDLAIGRLALAEERLQRMQQWDNGDVLSKEGFTMATQRALIFAQPEFSLAESVVEFYRLALTEMIQLQPELSLSRPSAWVEMYMALAAMARTSQNWLAVRQCLWRALQHDRMVWRKSAYIGGLLESTLGPRFFQMIRCVVSKFGGNKGPVQ